MIHTYNLTKKYGNILAVNNVNLNVRKGEIYGFLGPNGAGKTTTILMIIGLVKPTKGNIKLFGENLYENYSIIKNKIGIVSEESNFYGEMTAEEYLSFFADLFAIKNKSERISDIFKRIKLTHRKYDKLKQYSRGMKRKIEVARSLINDPELLIFDEPTSGLDPSGIKEIREIIIEENKKGKTIFISSHNLSEIEKICHRIGIINNGMLILEDTTANIKKELSNYTYIDIEVDNTFKENDFLIKKLNSFNFIKEVSLKERNLFTIKTDCSEDYRGKISQIFSDCGAIIIRMDKKDISLEDIFINITEKNN